MGDWDGILTNASPNLQSIAGAHMLWTKLFILLLLNVLYVSTETEAT